MAAASHAEGRGFQACLFAFERLGRIIDTGPKEGGLGHVTNRRGVLNEETTRHPDLFVCRQLRQPWPAFWEQFRNYG